MGMQESRVQKLQMFFAGEENVRLAFLIGSFAAGTARPDSDVDVAVLFGRVPDYMDVLGLRDRLSDLMKREADLVVLNDAGPVIRMQVLKTGIRLRAEQGASKNFSSAQSTSMTT
jgi:predicted nucleotidyltransferase